jgi:hypothetical protein
MHINIIFLSRENDCFKKHLHIFFSFFSSKEKKERESIYCNLMLIFSKFGAGMSREIKRKKMKNKKV